MREILATAFSGFSISAGSVAKAWRLHPDVRRPQGLAGVCATGKFGQIRPAGVRGSTRRIVAWLRQASGGRRCFRAGPTPGGRPENLPSRLDCGVWWPQAKSADWRGPRRVGCGV